MREHLKNLHQIPEINTRIACTLAHYSMSEFMGVLIMVKYFYNRPGPVETVTTGLGRRLTGLGRAAGVLVRWSCVHMNISLACADSACNISDIAGTILHSHTQPSFSLKSLVRSSLNKTLY